MIHLQGYVKATYHELVEALGEPELNAQCGDDKVSTEWCFEGWDYYGEPTPVTIYDWKDYDGGAKSRSGNEYEWNVGGVSGCAVDIVMGKLKKVRNT